MQTKPDTDAPSLTADDIADLRSAAGAMIPPAAEFDVPGADDPTIFADILASLGRDFQDVRAAVHEIRALAGGSLADLDSDRREAVIMSFHEQGGARAAALSRAVLQCYYRDDRVLRSVGHEPRPPFPMGHEVEQGDWSLLDAVRNRPKLWRDAP
ncbi:MAG: hypothetical protein AB7F35_18295 [Acetobacteraceae bacterium]